MPQMDGLETVTHIKKYLKDNKKPNIPVIFITGYADSDAHIKAEKIGKVIFKPFDMNEFLAEVAKSLSKDKPHGQ
jgi:response regulator RpfG family c-di-GMP phosphodiesterase